MTQRRTRLEVSLRFQRSTTREGRVPKARTIEAKKVIDRGAPRRTIRVDDELWSAAQAKATERGEDLSKVVRAALRAYIDGRLGQVVALADEAAS